MAKVAAIFGDDDEGVWMWIDNTISDAPVIAVDPSFAWSAPITFCPFCGRKLKEVKVDAD